MVEASAFEQHARSGLRSDGSVKPEGFRFGPALTVAAALAIALSLQHARLLEVWRTGGFFDTDDAMRMVQVRDLIAGQSWYDMTQYRLDPPGGVFMHWSRIVDLVLLLLLKTFGLFLAPDEAERAARIAFPSLVFTVLLAGGAWAGRIFSDGSTRVYGAFAVLFSGVFFWQFPPGRIDHHAPQITLLFFAVAALARAFDPAQARWAALTGACMAMSLGVGLENLPFFALIAVTPALVFVLRGVEARVLLRSFAIGLALTLTAVFLLTVGPRNWFVPACDALSAPWLVVALCGATAYGLLSFCGSQSLAGRIAALALVGAAALLPFVLNWPNCLQALYAGVDPVVKSLWLDHVGENLTLREDFAISPGGALLMALPILIGLGGAVFGVLSTGGNARARWLFLTVIVAAGFIAACICLRIFSSIMPLAALGLLAPVAALRRRLAGRGEALAATAGFVALSFLSSFGVALALPDLEAPAGGENSPDTFWRRPSSCLDSASYRTLSDLPTGVVVAPVPAGSYLLAHSRHSVLAAPYHRNNHGNRMALDILRSPPALAESLARKAGATYVMLCWETPADLAYYRFLGEDSLAAAIAAGRAPDWLRLAPVAGTPFHVFVVAPHAP